MEGNMSVDICAEHTKKRLCNIYMHSLCMMNCKSTGISLVLYGFSKLAYLPPVLIAPAHCVNRSAVLVQQVAEVIAERTDMTGGRKLQHFPQWLLPGRCRVHARGCRVPS